MGKKLVMVPADEVDLSEVEYKPEVIQGKLICSSIAFDFFEIRGLWFVKLIVEEKKRK